MSTKQIFHNIANKDFKRRSTNNIQKKSKESM